MNPQTIPLDELRPDEKPTTAEERERRAKQKVDREFMDAHDRKRHPYDCLVLLKGNSVPYKWGRFATVERAVAVGEEVMEEMRRPGGPRKGQMPYGGIAVGYVVVDSRDGSTVADTLPSPYGTLGRSTRAA